MISGPRTSREVEHDRGADRIDDEDRDLELALGHPAGQDRVRRIEGADVVVRVDAAGRVEVVVDHVVGGVRQDEPDDGEQEQAPVDRRAAADPVGLDRQQAADQARPDRHREDRGAGDDEPLADRVERARSRAGWRSRGSPSRRGGARGSGSTWWSGRGRRCGPSGPRAGAKTCVAECITFSRARRCEDVAACRPSHRSATRAVRAGLDVAPVHARAHMRATSRPRRDRDRRGDPGRHARRPRALPRVPDRRPERRSDRPAMARAGDRPRRRGAAAGSSARSGSTRHPTSDGRVEIGYRSSQTIDARASPPRSSGRCSTGRTGSTVSPGSGPPPRPTTWRRRASSPGSASARSASRWTSTTARSSSSSATAGPLRPDGRGAIIRVMPRDRRPRRPVVRHACRPRRCRARRADRGGRSADLPDLDLRAGRGRQAAPRLRVRPVAEPDPRSARTRGRRRSKAAGTGSRSRRARRRPPRSRELADPGEEIVVGDDVYGGTYRYLERVRKPGGGVTPTFIDLSAGMDALWEALSERTRLVWFESPTNPLLKTVDIAEVVRDRRSPRVPRVAGGRSSWSTTRSRRRPSSAR